MGIPTSLKRLVSFAVIAVVGGLATLSIAAPVSAAGPGLTICNRTSDLLGVAVGYYSPGVGDPADHSILTGPFVSEGWWSVASGQCATATNRFGARYMFWYAWSKSVNNQETGIEPLSIATPWTTNGTDNFCLPTYFNVDKVRTFTYEDENAGYAACHQLTNHIWVPVRKVDTAVNPVVQFTGQ
jgi:uncharacterized membrane protein